MQCWHHFVYENKTDPVFAPLSLKTTGNRNFKHGHCFWWGCLGLSLVQSLHLCISPSSFLTDTLVFCIHKGWGSWEFPTMPGSSCKKLWQKGENGSPSSTGAMQSDVLQGGWTYKRTVSPPPQKINFHRFCNLPVRWGEIMAPALSLKFPRDLSVFSENWIQNDRIIQTTNCLPESIKALKALPLEIWNLHPPSLPALWVSYNHCCMS